MDTDLKKAIDIEDQKKSELAFNIKQLNHIKEWLKAGNRSRVPFQKIERELGLPLEVLSKFYRGTRPFPIKYYDKISVLAAYLKVNYSYIPTEKELSIKMIQKVVCDHFNITPEQMNIKTRKRETVQARQLAHSFSKSLTIKSLAVIGKEIGELGHCDVLHSIKTVNNLCDTDKLFKRQYEEIERKIKSL
jgi:hypothetical protein